MSSSLTQYLSTFTENKERDALKEIIFQKVLKKGQSFPIRVEIHTEEGKRFSKVIYKLEEAQTEIKSFIENPSFDTRPAYSVCISEAESGEIINLFER